jgi:hypothetical protein
LFCALASAVLLALSIGPAAAEEARPAAGLKIASWDLAEAPELIPPPPPPTPKSAWRTTFGSERRTPPPRPEPAAPPVVDADAVLLQGVTDPKLLRRLFPAREWRLVVSREVFRPAAETDPVTAVAVRAREGLRVTGREFLLDPAQVASAPADDIAAPTAVRLSDRGYSVWLLSVALSSGCSSQRAPCPAREKIDAWQKAKGAAGERIVTGGKFAGAGAIVLPPPPCFQQSIEASLAASGRPVVKGKAQEQKGLGCLAVLDVPVE